MNQHMGTGTQMVSSIRQSAQGTAQTNRVTFFGIGEPVPFSFLGISIAFVAFLVIIVFVDAIKEIVEAQDIVW